MSIFISEKDLKKYKSEVKKILENDGLIIYPTDTIYGLGCNSFSKNAYEKLCEVKKINSKTPLIILVWSKRKALSLISHPRKLFSEIAKAFWPAPLTIIAKANSNIPSWLVDENSRLSIRFPATPAAQFIAKCLKKPIISTSANIHGNKPCNSIPEAYEIFKETIDIYVDAGELSSPTSTIIEISSYPAKIIREGAFPVSLIKEKFNLCYEN